MNILSIILFALTTIMSIYWLKIEKRNKRSAEKPFLNRYFIATYSALLSQDGEYLLETVLCKHNHPAEFYPKFTEGLTELAKNKYQVPDNVKVIDVTLMSYSEITKSEYEYLMKGDSFTGKITDRNGQCDFRKSTEVRGTQESTGVETPQVVESSSVEE